MKIKLSSNFQQVEIDLDEMDPDFDERLNFAIEITNRIGGMVVNSDTKDKQNKAAHAQKKETQRKEDGCTVRQAEKLAELFGGDAPDYYELTKKEAWKKIQEAVKK